MASRADTKSYGCVIMWMLGIAVVLAFLFAQGLSVEHDKEIEQKNVEYSHLEAAMSNLTETYRIDRKLMANTIRENLDLIGLLKIEIEELKK